MRATVNGHLRQQGLTRERVLASILRVLSTCYMRPGSEVYASEHGSYGIATLRRKHVTVKGDLIEFDFPGKSGVRQQRQLRDRQVARVIRASMKLPGFNVFKFVNGDGKPVKVTTRHINQYIKEDGQPLQRERLSHLGRHTRLRVRPRARWKRDPGAEDCENKRIVAAIKETSEVLKHAGGVSRLLRLSGNHQCFRKRTGDR